MSIFSIRTLPVILSGLALGPFTVFAQTTIEGPGMSFFDLSKAVISSQPVAGQVHMVKGMGGNIVVFTGDDGVFMVDDQFAPLTDKITAEISKLSDKPIRFLINTHFHGDHTGGNENLGKAGVLIFSHDNARRTLASDHYIEALKSRFAAYNKIALPVATYSEQMTFHLNGEDVRVFHVANAHTDGDSVVYFPDSDVIAVGDVYQRLGYPVFDRGNGGSFAGLIKAWEKILQVMGKDTKIVQGHGGVSNRAELEKAHADMVLLRDRIQSHISAGKSLQEVIAAAPSKGLDAGWPPMPLPRDTVITWIYEELSK